MNSKETAVIFIEFQNEFCKTQGVFNPSVQPELQRIGTLSNAKKLLAFAREKKLGIIHCPFVIDEEWIERNRIVGLIADAKNANACIPNTWGSSIIEEMEPLPSETVLTGKRALSAFVNTELPHIIKLKGYKNLLVCGLLTNVCVQATALSAYDRGINTRIVLDACASTAPEIQAYVETRIAPVLGGAMTVEDVLRSVEA